MKSFVVFSEISPKKGDVATWVLGIPQLLTKAKVDDVKFKTAYCCTLDGKVIAEFESDYKEAVKKALTEIEMPFTSVMEATKV